MKIFLNCLPPAGARRVTASPIVWLAALLVWFVSAGATLLRADPGDVDLSFNIGSGPNLNVLCTVIRTNDDSIFIGGIFDGYAGSKARRIARLKVTGAFDPAFNTGGFESSVNGLALWPNNATNAANQMIIAVGEFNSVDITPGGNSISSPKIARLDNNGAPDFQFSQNIGLGPDVGVNCVTVQPDNKILIGGRFQNFNSVTRNRVARLNADGTLDTSFDPGLGPDSDVVSIQLQSDGKIILCGRFTSYNGTPNHEGIVRLNPDGSLDASFTARAAQDNATGLVNGSVIQESLGKIIVFGGFFVFNNQLLTNPKIIRLNLADGTTDTTYGLGTSFNSDIRDAHLLPNGKLLCVGVFDKISGISRRGAARLNANGTHDLTFNPGTGAGKVLGQTNSNSGLVNSSALDSLNRLLIVGDFNDFNQVTNYHYITRVGTADPTPPLITTQPQDQTVPQGSNATFTVGANPSPLSFQWRFNGVNIPNATNTSLTITNAQPGNQGPYSVVVSNSLGTVTSSNATLTVLRGPFFVTPPQSITNLVGANVSFSVIAGGSFPLFYQWVFNGTALPGQTNTTLNLNNIQLTDAGTYTIVVSNTIGSITNSATLTIPSPPSIQPGPNGGGPADGQPQSLTIVQGQSATFSVNVVGSAPLTYQWRFGGVNITGATNTSVTLNNVQANQAGLYSVVITNPFGVTTSANATLTVLLPPSIIVQPVSQTITQGSTINLSVTATGSPTLTYQWSLNGTPIPGGTSATLSLFNAQKSLQGNYVCLVSNPYGTANSAVAVVTIQAPPVIFDNGQPQPQTVIQGSNATFSVTANGDQPFTYQWRFNGTNIVGATTNPLVLSGVVTNQAGNYSVVVSNPFGTVTSSNALLTVRVAPFIVTQPSPQNQTVVAGSNATITVVAGGDPTLTYQWLFNGAPVPGATAATLAFSPVQLAQLGNYTVVVSNPYGSVTSAAATLSVKNPPFVATQPQSLTVVQGQLASFNVTAGGDGPFTYQWRFGGVPIAGATNSIYGFANSQPTNAGNYSVVISSPYGSVTSSNALLTVRVPPAIVVQPQPATGITGGGATFNVVASGDPALLYQWWFNGVPIIGATNATLTLNNLQTSQAGFYSVFVSNPYGTAASINAPLTVKVAPFTATQPQSLTVIQGSTATFAVTAGGDGPFTYQWLYFGTLIGGATNSSLTLTNVVTSQAGNYSVIITSPYGTTTSTNALLTVKVPPAIIVPPVSQTIIVGVTANLSVLATGDQPLTYQWLFNGSPLSGATNASLSLPNIQASQTGNYTVVVSNPYGTVTSPIATLSVKTPPFAATQPQSLTVLQGANAAFSVTAGGDGPFTYQWFFNGLAVPGAANATLALTSVTTNQAGNYSVIITSPYGSINSANALLTVRVPPAIIVQPVSQTIIVGVTANLFVQAVGDQPLTYQWFFNGNPLTGGTNATLILPNIQASQTGNYTVVVTNPYGTVTSSIATLSVKTPPFAATQPQSLTILQGANAAFSVTAGGDGPFTYQWLYNGFSMPNATNATLAMTNVTTNQAGNYSVIITSPYGSINSANALLTVRVPPAIIVQPVSQTIIVGVTANLFVQATGDQPLTYQWLFKGTPITGGTNAALTLPNIQASQTGDYTVVVSNPYGTVTSSIATLSVKTPPFAATQPQSLSILQGANAAFSVTAGGDGPFTYQWLYGGLSIPGATNATLAMTNVTTNQAGNYAVIITSPYGTVTSANALLTVHVPPSIVTPPATQAVVAGVTVTFTVTAAGDLPLTYQWLFNGSPLSGATNPTLTLVGVQAGQAGNYSVVVTNPYGTATSATAALAVKVPPSVNTQPQSLTVLKGTNASFSVVAAGDAPITYQWLFGGVTIPGATNATLNLTNVQTNQAGLYSVVISNPVGSVTSSNATLTVLDPPVIVLQPTPATGLAGDTVAFVVVATGRSPLLYQWCKNGVDIPGATGAMLTLTNISAADVGNYCVKVTNPDGSVTSITVPLTLSQRTLTVVTVQTTNFTAGTPISVPVALLAEGGENRVLGSIAYDTNKLNFISVTTPVGATLASTNAAGQGQIGFDVALPAAQTFTPGSNVVVFVNFTVNPGVTQSICGINLQGVPVTNQVLNAVGAPLPSYFISGAVIFKSLTDYTLRSQTGATEDLMPVLNPAGSVSALTFLRISFFDLGKDSLGNAIYIINATGTNNGTPYILIPSTVAPAGTFPLNVEYYVSDRVTSPKPRLVVEIVTGGYPVVPTGVVLSADRSQFNVATGRFVVDFSSTAGKTYYIQYSSSPAGPYDTSFPGVAGTGGRLQWVDTGPPRTTSLPATAGSRFYRILQVP